MTVPLTRSFAGNIPVNRAGHPNDTLFFWAFEKQNGSLTAPANKSNDDPWIIWLQGGWVLLAYPFIARFDFRLGRVRVECLALQKRYHRITAIYAELFCNVQCQNGPLRIQPNSTFTANYLSWNALVDIFWIDQPVGEHSHRYEPGRP